MKYTPILLALGCALMLLTGCGSFRSTGRTPGMGTSGNGAATLVVNWPARAATRLIPQATNIIQVTIRNSAGGLVTQQIISRPASGATTTSTNFTNLPVDTLQVTASAYAGYDQTTNLPVGSMQAQGVASLPITAGSNTVLTLVMSSTVTTLVITPNSNPIAVKTGNTVQLTAMAKDHNGNTVLLAPGVLKWSSANANGDPAHSDVVSVDSTGRVKGLTAGNAVVTAQDSESSVTATANVQVADQAPIQVSITPATVTIPSRSSNKFSAQVINSQTTTHVTWTVEGGDINGVITPDGQYTAPDTAGTYHVIATSVEDPTRSATATVIVTVWIELAPSVATVAANGTLTYTAHVYGSKTTKVLWSVQEGQQYGTITPTDETQEGTFQHADYVAPNLNPGTTGIYHIVASSKFDPSIIAVAVVTVNPPATTYHQTASYSSASGIADTFFSPSGIAVAPSGAFVLSDTGKNRLVEFTSAGVFARSYGTAGATLGQFNTPLGVALDSAGSVYVADAWNRRVQKFVNASPLAMPGWNGIINDQAGSRPASVAVDALGYTYLVDSVGNRVVKLDSTGNIVYTWGVQGNGDGQFLSPMGITVDGVGNIYVADTLNNRIVKYNTAGVLLATFGEQGSLDGQFSQPRGVAVDVNGNVYVADTLNNRVQKFDGSGAFLGTWGSFILNTPTGLGVDRTGNVYVVDSGNNRVLKFAP